MPPNKESRPRLPEFEPRIHKGTGASIIALPDIDIDIPTQVWIPLIGHGAIKDLRKNVFPAYPDSTVRYVKPNYIRLPPGQIDNIHYAVTRLNLPPLIATHLVLNKRLGRTAITQQFFAPADPDQLIPRLYSISGASLQGKTIFALWAKLSGEKVVNFDKFSLDNLEIYSHIVASLKNPTLPQVVDLILQYFQKRGSARPNQPLPQDWNTIVLLDNLTQLFVEGQRPPIVLIDMPGFRIDSQGRTIRSLGPLDVMAKYSLADMIVIQRMISTSQDQKLAQFEPIIPEVIQGYWEEYKQMTNSPNLHSPSSRLKAFLSLIAPNS